MTETVGVRFKDTGKIYLFDKNGSGAKIGDHVIVETIRGIEYGTVVTEKEMEEEEASKDLKPVIRVATPEDTDKQIDNKNRAKEALIICHQRIKDHGLDMRLVGSEYTFDNSKLLFYFTSDQRIDFRELVRDLAGIFRTRIELRQIGVRDEAKIIGALGCCGRETCCSNFLSEFQPVSIKMAKDQGLSLNPTKISGICGRLMCCLKYEQDGYECILKRMPKVGEVVGTSEGKGTVVDTYNIQELVKVRFGTEEEGEEKLFELSEVKRTHKFDRKLNINRKDFNREEDASEEELKQLQDK